MQKLFKLFLCLAALAVAGASQATLQADPATAAQQPAGTLNLAQGATAAAPAKPFYDPLLFYNPYMCTLARPLLSLLPPSARRVGPPPLLCTTHFSRPAPATHLCPLRAHAYGRRTRAQQTAPHAALRTRTPRAHPPPSLPGRRWMYWNPYMWMYWNPMMWMYYPYMMWW